MSATRSSFGWKARSNPGAISSPSLLSAEPATPRPNRASWGCFVRRWAFRGQRAAATRTTEQPADGRAHRSSRRPLVGLSHRRRGNADADCRRGRQDQAGCNAHATGIPVRCQFSCRPVGRRWTDRTGSRQALLHPVWPLFLGRKSCPPSVPLLGRNDESDVGEFPDLEAAFDQSLGESERATILRAEVVECLLELPAAQPSDVAPPDAEVWTMSRGRSTCRGTRHGSWSARCFASAATRTLRSAHRGRIARHFPRGREQITGTLNTGTAASSDWTPTTAFASFASPRPRPCNISRIAAPAETKLQRICAYSATLPRRRDHDRVRTRHGPGPHQPGRTLLAR